jgi:hypothetical protein
MAVKFQTRVVGEGIFLKQSPGFLYGPRINDLPGSLGILGIVCPKSVFKK